MPITPTSLQIEPSQNHYFTQSGIGSPKWNAENGSIDQLGNYISGVVGTSRVAVHSSTWASYNSSVWTLNADDSLTGNGSIDYFHSAISVAGLNSVGDWCRVVLPYYITFIPNKWGLRKVSNNHGVIVSGGSTFQEINTSYSVVTGYGALTAGDVFIFEMIAGGYIRVTHNGAVVFTSVTSFTNQNLTFYTSQDYPTGTIQQPPTFGGSGISGGYICYTAEIDILASIPMVLSFNKSAHRCDSTSPIYTAIGIDNIGKIKLGSQQYLSILNSVPTAWTVPNRTQLTDVCLKNVKRPTWVRDSGINLTGSNDLSKSGADGFTGAYVDIDEINCGIEAKTTSAASNHSLALSLQSGTPNQDFFGSTDSEHALVFGGSGLGAIYEKGVAKLSFTFISGDSGLIEKRGGIVRYYKVSASGSLTLLRSTRSTLNDGDIKAAVMLYYTGNSADNIYIWSGEEVAQKFQIWAVLQDFQDWQNQSSIDSLGEKSVTKDRRELVTYFTDQTSLRTVSVNLGWRKLTEYQEFQEFWKWHDLSEPFIFVDVARQTEYFAKFVSSFKDNPLPGAIYGIQTDVRELIDPPSLVIF